MQIMVITKALARKLAQRILQENENGRSYRVIAAGFPRREDGTPIVKAGTLNRIARAQGDWLPKDREILIALGLIERRAKEPLPEWLQRRKKAIRRMAKETRKALKVEKKIC